MNIETVTESGVTVLIPEGRLDTKDAGVFEAHCKACIASGTSNLLVDLGKISYISSAGLRSALIVGKLLNEKGGRICFFNAPQNVHDVFVVSGFSQIFQFFNTKEEALRSFS